MDVLKYFREFLGLRDNESQLYFTRETTFMTSSLLSAHRAPSEKGSVLQEKNCSNFFPVRVDPFQKGVKTILTKKVYPCSLKTDT